MFPVVIGTHPNRTAWLEDCLASVKATTDRPVIIHRDGGYELAALRTGISQADRFLFIHDSVTILVPEFWDHINEPSWLTGHPPMNMGIFDSAQLAPVLEQFPATVDKEQAIHMETVLPTLLPMPTIWPDITDANALRREHRHGRDNLILGNKFMEKAKGTWR